MALGPLVTIRLKILVGCLGLTLMTALLGLYDRSVEERLGDLSVRLYDDAFQAMSYLRAAQNDLLVAAALPDQDATVRLNDALQNIAIAEQRAMSPAGLKASAGLHTMLTHLESTHGPARLPGFAAAQDSFDTAVEIYAADGYHFRRVVGDVLVSTGRNALTMIGVSVAAALLIIISLTRSILPQLREAVGVAQAIAAGRLDNPIRLRGRSETAMLLRALATMQSAIAMSLAENRVLLEQQSAAHDTHRRHQSEVDAVVTRFGGSMAGVFHTVSAASVGMAATADGLLADAEALLRNEGNAHDEIAQVVARIDNASQSSRALSEAIVGIRAQTAQTEQRARSTLVETQAATLRMQTLGRAADEISSVAGMIVGLAVQTKLLALNASIEAARAGHAGLGFAVVATEVKRLAERSAQAAQIVGQRIASILEAAKGAHASIAAIVVSTEDVHRLSASIAQAVAAQDTASLAISTSVSEIVVNATNVKESIGTIGTLTRVGAGRLRGIGGEAQSLSENAADLNREASAFMEFMNSFQMVAVTAPIRVRAPARLVMGDVQHTGVAVFISEFALFFVPQIEAKAGATGVLYLTGVDYSTPVRVVQSDGAATQLQPPLADADRARLRAVLDKIGAQAPAETPSHPVQGRVGATATPGHPAADTTPLPSPAVASAPPQPGRAAA